MKTLLVSLAVLLVMLASARSESFSGPGPDPGGDGSALTIQFQDGKPTFFENATFNSDKTYAVRFRLDAKGEWNVVILVYSAHGSEQDPPAKDKLLATYKFKSTDTAAGDKACQKLERETIAWSAEPARLLKFYKENKADFEKNEATYDPSAAEDK